MMIETLQMVALLLISLTIGLRLQRAVGSPQSILHAVAIFGGLLVGVVLGVRVLAIATMTYETQLPMLKGWLLSAFGLAWFSNTLIAQRLASQRCAEATLPQAPDRLVLDPALSVMNILVAGINLGFLLFVLDEQDIQEEGFAVGVVSVTAMSAFPRKSQSTVVGRMSDPFVRCLTGACLFALGTGAVVEHAGDTELSAGLVAGLLAAVLSAIGAFELWSTVRRGEK